MTIKEVFDFVDTLKPNGFTVSEKIMWLNEIEGKIQTEVMLLSPADVRKYIYSSTYTAAGIFFPDGATMVCPTKTGLRPYGTITITGLTTYSANNITATINSVSSDGKTLYFNDDTFSATGTTGDAGEATLTYDGSGIELLVPAPHDKLYYTYLQAMIDFYNGEYDRYSNAITLWNSFYDEYRKWYSHHINPATGNAFSMGYYISAYGIALKNGYTGTEEEWLDTLVGPQGAKGVGITSILKTSTAGLIDTYTITFNDGTTTSYGVANGANLTIDTALSDTSENAVQNKVIKREIDLKQDITSALGLGITSTTAYYGDKGKTAYDHSQATGNPHGTTKTDIGLSNVDNTSDANKPISIETQTALNAKQNSLTFDSTPTDGSTNPVTSSGVYDALHPTYELIEKIIVGYSLTTSQPADWLTNWTSYYTNTGTAVSPVYTAVGGASAPTWAENTHYSYSAGGVSVVDRTVEPDNSDYNFNRIMMKTDFKGWSGAYSPNFYGYFNDTDYIYTVGQSFINTAERWGAVEFYQSSGFWGLKVINASTTNVYYNQGAVYESTYYWLNRNSISLYPAIVRAKITATNIPSLSVIEIWGVRA